MLDGFRMKDWLVRPDKKVKLSKRPTRIEPLYTNDDDYDGKLDSMRALIADQQDLLFADQRYAPLLIFQGMDTAGKDGAIKHVLRDLNPQGMDAAAFASPSQQDLSHDFLWRTHQKLPARGKIGLFNRSYYEEVLTVRVHPQYLEKQRIPEEHVGHKHFWDERLADIANHEDYLHRQGYRIAKFYFHLSKEEQRERLLARMDDPKKNWKFDPADLEARSKWSAYMNAYEDCMEATSTKESPWFVVPADDKKNARLIVAQIITEFLEKIPARFPRVTEEQKREMKKARKTLKG